jgi:2-polyprenyl-3-methyl-5-hydroxy-6-metoxy-1,4-benzoquinol methylase
MGFDGDVEITLPKRRSREWRDDPKHIGFVLARHKFVAKMFQGKGTICEVGCGDGFGARVVAQNVQTLHLCDADPIWLEQARQYGADDFAERIYRHDIVKDGPLRITYNAIYMLDVIEHIHPFDEDCAIDHLIESLTRHGTLIIGAPTLEFQQYASEYSKQYHVNCKTGEKFRSDLAKRFENVFMFGMTDEIIHTGFSPMNCYHLAICTGAN